MERAGEAAFDRGDRGWAVLVVAISASFAAVSLAWELRVTRSPLVLPAQLGTELTPAAWWSGSLLLLAALAAVERAHGGPVRTRRGWASLAVVLAVMSLSEIGSVHERLGSLAIVPYVLVLGGLFGLATVHLWADAALRLRVTVIAASFGSIALTTLQEYAKGYGTGFDDVPLLRVGIEETVEVLAFTAVFLAVAAGPRGRPAGKGLRALVPGPVMSPLMLRVVVLLLVAHLLFSVSLAPVMRIGQQGDLAVWFPSAAFLWTSARYVHRDLDTAHRGDRLRAGHAALMSLAAVVLLSPAGLDRLQEYSVPVHGRQLWAGLLLLTIALLWDRATGRVARTVAAVAVVLVTTLEMGPTVHYVLGGAVAGVPVVAALRAAGRSREPTAAPAGSAATA